MTSNKIYISVDKKVLILPNKWISPVVVNQGKGTERHSKRGGSTSRQGPTAQKESTRHGQK